MSPATRISRTRARSARLAVIGAQRDLDQFGVLIGPKDGQGSCERADRHRAAELDRHAGHAQTRPGAGPPRTLVCSVATNRFSPTRW
jgi:hypothetical protein